MVNFLRKKYDCNHFSFHDDELLAAKLRQFSNANIKKIDGAFSSGWADWSAISRMMTS